MFNPQSSLITAVRLLLILGSAVHHEARAAQINFDDAPNGTIIDSRYPGVTFGCIACGSGHSFARDMASFGSTTAASEPNVVTLVPPFNAADPNSSILTSFNAAKGAVSAAFSVPQRVVRIDARPQLPLEFLGSANNKPFMEVYSSTNPTPATFLGRVLYPLNFGDPGYCTPNTSACGGPFRTLEFTSTSDNIGSILLSSQQSQGGPSVYADFDNLVFETGSSLLASSAQAAMASDFNSGLPSGMSFFGGAKVEAGFLKLLSVPNDSFGIAYINDFNKGQPVHGFRATFDAALFGATCCGGGLFPADGFSFNLVPAATVLANPGYGEPGEEGLAAGLAVNFDTWDNGGGEAPAIEVKWLDQVIARASFQASQSPAGAPNAASALRAVVINLDTDGTLDVSYGGIQVLSDVPTPYQPSVIGVPKWVLGARVGQANDNHWFDNLRITAYAGPRSCCDFNAGVPPDINLFGQAQVAGGFLKLISLPGDSHGIAYIRDFGAGQLVQAFRASFKASLFGAICCEEGQFPADGFSFNLVPAATARTNPGYGEPAEEGLDEGLAVTFDTWDNLDGGGEAPAIEIKWLGQIVAWAPFQASQSPAGITDPLLAAREVVINLDTDGTLDVSYGGVSVFNNVQTPFNPAVIGTPLWVMGARVGLANDNHWFDDLCITAAPVARRPIPGLFNTGVDAHARPLAENQADPHYRSIPNGPSIQPSFPTYAATSAGGFPIPPWLPDNRSSSWISPGVDTLMPGNTSHIYETSFDLTGLDPATAQIAGRWSADNQGTGIILNGQPVSVLVAPDFTVWTPFQITTGFVSGTNTLRFIVFNAFDFSGSNPEGLRVEMAGTAAVACGILPSAPTLQIRRVASGVELGWRGAGFVLQETSTLGGRWRDAARGMSGNGPDFTAAVSTNRATRFFRLRRDCP
jgi:hypothetical protein